MSAEVLYVGAARQNGKGTQKSVNVVSMAWERGQLISES